jgi:NTE family protein
MLDNSYKCNNIDTLVLSGGGTHGIVYLSILNFLTEQNILPTITKYYGVSAGSLTALCFIIGLTYDEIYDLFINKINFKELMKIELSNILTINKKLGINDGTKLESTIKHVLEFKGLNPYISLAELYKHTNKELYIGATSLFKGKFVLFSHKSHPNLPVWVAIRMSCSIPILFTPLQYYELNDIFVDGAILNNNPVNYVIKELLQTENNKTEDNCIYNFNFICINLQSFDNSVMNINDLSFIQYLKMLINQYSINQSHNKDKYANYIIQIPSYKYSCFDIFNKIENEKIDYALAEIYKIFKEEFNKKIKNNCPVDN